MTAGSVPSPRPWPQTSVGQPALGIVLKLASTLVFTAMSTLVKMVADRVPVGEIVFARSFFAILPIFVYVLVRGELATALFTRRLGGHIGRAAIGAASMGCNFIALGLLPLADATAIGFASPLITVVLAVLLLGEIVRVYRWSAVAVGFFGVIIMLSPNLGSGAAQEGETLGALLALAGAALGALSLVVVRRLIETEATSTVVFYFSLSTSLFALVTMPFGWVVPDLELAAILITIGILGGIGQILLTQSYRYAEASVIAPFDYTTMVWALIIGFVVFSETVAPAVLLGASIVIGSGLFVIYRERKLGIERRREKAVRTPT